MGFSNGLENTRTSLTRLFILQPIQSSRNSFYIFCCVFNGKPSLFLLKYTIRRIPNDVIAYKKK